MLIGYARVSTADQRLDLQTDALQGAGCERLFTDAASGARADRPGLQEALDFARTGDTLVVWRLDRFGRSLKDLVERVETLRERGVGFRSLQEGIDTTSPSGSSSSTSSPPSPSSSASSSASGRWPGSRAPVPAGGKAGGRRRWTRGRWNSPRS